jgi:hypothetical protein
MKPVEFKLKISRVIQGSFNWDDEFLAFAAGSQPITKALNIATDISKDAHARAKERGSIKAAYRAFKLGQNSVLGKISSDQKEIKV